MAHKLNVQLFTTPVCPNCPSAKAIASEVLTGRDGVNLSIVNAFEHQDLVARYGLQAVPAFVVNGCLWATGIPTREHLEQLIATGWECRQVEGQHLHSHGPGGQEQSGHKHGPGGHGSHGGEH